MYATHALRRATQIRGDAIATVCNGRTYSYRQCMERVARLAGAMRKLGITDDERVAILALNSDRYYEYFYAVPWAGGIFVPINIRLAPPEVAFWLNDSGSQILFIDDNFLPILKALEGKLETVKEIVYIGDGETPEGMHNYEDILAASEPVEDAGRGHNDLIGIFYTGGTTGRSKGVMLTHTNFITNNLSVIGTFGFDMHMTWLHAPPMFHIADGLAVFSVTMVAGSHVFIPRFDPAVTLKAIAEQGITHTLLVPTMINMLVNFPDFKKYDVSGLQKIAYGASPMPEAVIRQAMEALPHVNFYHAYGQTECSPLVSSTGPEYHVLEGPQAGMFRSAGQPVIGVEVKIADEDGNEVPRGTVGEICSRGPHVMKGYWQLPDLTAEAIRDGWMHSGDAAFMDDDGFIFIVDRVKDMIISGGENIYSVEVEDVIHKHPDVIEAAVIGIPHDQWGESVHAVVRLHEGAFVDEETLIAWCRESIAAFKCPRSISFSDEPLPLSGAGKILKTDLREPFWQDRDKRVN